MRNGIEEDIDEKESSLQPDSHNIPTAVFCAIPPGAFHFMEIVLDRLHLSMCHVKL
jgi:hypothetical protein